MTISRLVNAFFRWEFNSCEIARPRHRRAPDRLRQRLPGRGADLPALLLPVGDDGAGALDRVLRGHRPEPRLDLDTARYFAIADATDLSYAEKLAGYRRLADDYFETDRYRSSARPACRTSTRSSTTGSARPTSTRCCVDTVRATYPAHEHERFLAHFRGLIDAWLADQR